MKRFLCLLLVFSALLISCHHTASPPETDTAPHSETSSDPEALKKMDLISNGKSSYVIVYDIRNAATKKVALNIQSRIFKASGVMIPVRELKDAAHHRQRILIGDLGDPETDRLKKLTPKNRFAFSTASDTLILFADSVTGFLSLERYFEKLLSSTAKDGQWSLNENMTYTKEENTTMKWIADGVTEYPLVIQSKNPDLIKPVLDLAAYIREKYRLNFKVVTDEKEYRGELLFGITNRPIDERINLLLGKEDDYFCGVLDSSCVIRGNCFFVSALHLLNLARTASADENRTAELTEQNNCSGQIRDLEKNSLYAEAASVTKKLMGTYGSMAEHVFYTVKGCPEDFADCKLVDALIARMEDSAAFCIGSSSVLFRGYIRKTDPNDYSKETYRDSEGHIHVGAFFLNQYFGTEIPADARGYVDLTDYCNQHENFLLTFHEETRIAVLTPTGAPAFDRLTEKTDGFSVLDLLNRMDRFFHNPEMPEPDTDVEQTRQTVVEAAHPDPDYVYDFRTEEYPCFASPSVLYANHVLYVAYDSPLVVFEEKGSGGPRENDTYLLKSTDNGKTWIQIGTVKNSTFATLFELNGKIYLTGKRFSGKGNVFVGVYSPEDSQFRCADLDIVVMGTAPTAVAIHNGRIWRAHNNGIISAPTDSDLLKTESWTVSQSPNQVFQKEDYESITGLKVKNRFWLEEGNTVAGKNGKLYAIYRIDASPTWGYAVILEISEDGKTLTPVKSDACVGDGLIRFPCNQTKFTVRYDQKTGLYLSIASIPTVDLDNKRNLSPHQRNMAVLIASDDLFHWKEVGVLLTERQMMNTTFSAVSHAFQYVDFDFAGNDICFVVRESFGKSCNYHNSNAITLYRLENYKEFIIGQLNKTEERNQIK